MNKSFQNKKRIVIFFYDNSIRELKETQGNCIYLKELLTNYENEYGELCKDCFIVGEFDTIDNIKDKRIHYIKNPVKLELDLDLNFDLKSMVEENPRLRFADSRQVHFSNLLEVLRNTLTFYTDGLYQEIQYIGIKEYVLQKHSDLNDESEDTIVQTMQNEIYSSILRKDFREIRKQNEALKKYEKYVGAKYKLVDLKKDQRKSCNLKDELEIEFEDGTRIVRTVEWIIKNSRVINAEIIVEDNKVLFIGVAYHPEIWSRYYLC